MTAAPDQKARAVAEFLLNCATELGIAVGCNGDDVATICPSRVPYELGRWLHRELNKHTQAVHAIILDARLILSPDTDEGGNA